MNNNDALPANLCGFIWHFLKPYKHIVLLYATIALLAGCWGPFNSLLIKSIINDLSEPSIMANISSLYLPAALLVINFIVFDNFTWRSIGCLNYKYQPIIKTQIISQTFEYILGSSQQFFLENLSGRLANHITTLADNIERILHNISANLFRGISLLLLALISMYLVNLNFFFILIIWFILFATFSVFMSTQLVNLSDINTKAESIVSGQLVDNISNVSNIRIFARKFYEIFRLESFLDLSKETFRKKEAFIVVLHAVQGTLIALMLGFMIYYLLYLYKENLVTIGDFALILGLSMEVAHITWYTMSELDEFNQAVGKCRQSLASLIVFQEVKDKPGAQDLQVNQGKINFVGVKFHYKGLNPLFQNMSVSIEAGQKVGLVGYSGSGKSTFASLILRIYDIADGHILIDNQDISEVTQESLRSNIAMIPQDPSLFHRSILENIRYGRLKATDEEVIEAAEKAYADEFISRLPQGYESLVGERGIKLSGGQRQRIAIARAILKNAPILVLDEATSQLDSITESMIQESVWMLMQNKTTIIIAHRLSTLLHMDRILVFDQGQIVEDGSHSELLESNGLYKTLWDSQVGGFLPDKQH